MLQKALMDQDSLNNKKAFTNVKHVVAINYFVDLIEELDKCVGREKWLIEALL